MAKLSKKKIQAKMNQAIVGKLTNQECSKQILFSLRDDTCLSAQVGLAISFALISISENKYHESLAFEELIKSMCFSAQRALSQVFNDDLEQEYPMAGIHATVLQILVHAKLVKGVYSPLIPSVEKGKIAVKTNIEPSGVEITDIGREFLNRFNSSKSIFAECRDSIRTSSELAIEYAQKVADKYQDQ